MWRTLQWWCSVLIPTQARSLNAHASFEAQPCGLLVSVQSQPFKISPVVWIRLYHAATKRRLELPKAMAAICLVNVLTFEYLSNMYFGLLAWLYKCNSPCFRSFKNNFMNITNYVHFVREIFVVNYHVTHLIDQALLTSLFHVKAEKSLFNRMNHFILFIS